MSSMVFVSSSPCRPQDPHVTTTSPEPTCYPTATGQPASSVPRVPPRPQDTQVTTTSPEPSESSLSSLPSVTSIPGSPPRPHEQHPTTTYPEPTSYPSNRTDPTQSVSQTTAIPGLSRPQEPQSSTTSPEPSNTPSRPPVSSMSPASRTPPQDPQPVTTTYAEPSCYPPSTTGNIPSMPPVSSMSSLSSVSSTSSLAPETSRPEYLPLKSTRLVADCGTVSDCSTAVTDRKEIGASLAERMESSVRVRQPANPSSRMSFSVDDVVDLRSPSHPPPVSTSAGWNPPPSIEVVPQERELTDAKIDELCSALTKEDTRRLGHKLGMASKDMDIHFSNHSTSITEAVNSILKTWLKRQRNRKEAYINLGKALCDQDVGLNLYAGEVLAYPPLEQPSG